MEEAPVKLELEEVDTPINCADVCTKALRAVSACSSVLVLQ